MHKTLARSIKAMQKICFRFSIFSVSFYFTTLFIILSNILQCSLVSILQALYSLMGNTGGTGGVGGELGGGGGGGGGGGFFGGRGGKGGTGYQSEVFKIFSNIIGSICYR